MNLVITRSEELDFPNFETCLYPNCKARFVVFNRFGTLLAIGCKYGVALIMDFISKEIVRIFNYFTTSDFAFNSDMSNFVQFSNGDYNQIYDLFEHEELQTSKKIPKIPSPESKDYSEVAISDIEWSFDSNYLLVSYQLVNKVILWNVETCERIFEVNIDDKVFVKAQLYPYNINVAIVSCSQPYIIDMKTKEIVKFLIDQDKGEEEKMALSEIDQKKAENISEEWLALALSKNKTHFFFLVTPRNYLILLKERAKGMEDIKEKTKEFLKDIYELINTEKFEVVTVLPLVFSGRIVSLIANDSQDYVLLNATDRFLRLIAIDYQKKELIMQKECFDVINRKKWMATSFFTVGHPEKKQYIVSGVGESGSHDICFMSMDNNNTEKRLGPSKEGCIHLCSHYIYHNSIVVVSSNGDLLLWSVKNPKCWTALAPDFTEIEENIEYIEKEDEFDAPNTTYVPPVTDPTEEIPVYETKNYFDVDRDVYLHYSKLECLDKGTDYEPTANLVMVKPTIKADFLTAKGKADVKKLKEKMESKGITISKKIDGGLIDIIG